MNMTLKIFIFMFVFWGLNVFGMGESYVLYIEKYVSGCYVYLFVTLDENNNTKLTLLSDNLKFVQKNNKIGIEFSNLLMIENNDITKFSASRCKSLTIEFEGKKKVMVNFSEKTSYIFFETEFNKLEEKIYDAVWTKKNEIEPKNLR